MKTYRTLMMGRGRRVVSFHDGIKTHSDGSAFFDMRIFRDARKAERFVRELQREGYAPA